MLVQIQPCPLLLFLQNGLLVQRQGYSAVARRVRVRFPYRPHMSKQKLIYAKGYQLEVDSWENDGDFNKTIVHHVKDLEEAEALKRMCDVLFKSYHSSNFGISNDYSNTILDYEDTINKFFDGDPYFKNVKKEDRVNYVEDVIEKLLGWSEEGYSARVASKCTILYVKEDIHVEVIRE